MTTTHFVDEVKEIVAQMPQVKTTIIQGNVTIAILSFSYFKGIE